MEDLLFGKKLLRCVVKNEAKEIIFEALFVGGIVEDAETGNRQVALDVGLVPAQAAYNDICNRYGVENLEWELMKDQPL